MSAKRRIVYWGFAIDIVGPQHKDKNERRKIRKLLSKIVPEIEKEVLTAVKTRLPRGFRAKLY